MEIDQVKTIVTERVTIPKVERKKRGKKDITSYPIGIFDSGVGGLTVLTRIMKQLPDEDVIYLADTAHVPYGGRTKQEILDFNYKIIDYLISEKVKMIIMACGTSSSLAYPEIKNKYSIPIVSLIEPGAKAAVAATKNKKIGVLATVATVHSSSFKKAIKEIDPEIKVVSESCPLFVPLVEGGFLTAGETKKVTKEYLKHLMNEGVDTIILGCTHYPHLLPVLEEVAGEGVSFIDPAVHAVAEAKGILHKLSLQSEKKKPKYSFKVTGALLSFKELAERLLDKRITDVKQLLLWR
jgi:glutamate racemase